MGPWEAEAADLDLDIEMLAYLGTRPHGATPAQLADAFGITLGRARTGIKTG